MSLDQLTAAAFRRIPASGRGTITFIDKNGRETSAQAAGVPAKGADSDGFRAGVEIREKHRRLSVAAEGLTFVPKAGQYAMWESVKWNVLSATPVKPNGSTVFLYRVTLSK